MLWIIKKLTGTFWGVFWTIVKVKICYGAVLTWFEFKYLCVEREDFTLYFKGCVLLFWKCGFINSRVFFNVVTSVGLFFWPPSMVFISTKLHSWTQSYIMISNLTPCKDYNYFIWSYLWDSFQPILNIHATDGSASGWGSDCHNQPPVVYLAIRLGSEDLKHLPIPVYPDYRVSIYLPFRSLNLDLQILK